MSRWNSKDLPGAPGPPTKIPGVYLGISTNVLGYSGGPVQAGSEDPLASSMVIYAEPWRFMLGNAKPTLTQAPATGCFASKAISHLRNGSFQQIRGPNMGPK